VNGQFQVSHSGCENKILRYYCKASNIVGSVRSPLITIQGNILIKHVLCTHKFYLEFFVLKVDQQSALRMRICWICFHFVLFLLSDFTWMPTYIHTKTHNFHNLYKKSFYDNDNDNSILPREKGMEKSCTSG
jgi:hypothetical protein